MDRREIKSRLNSSGIRICAGLLFFLPFYIHPNYPPLKEVYIMLDLITGLTIKHGHFAGKVGFHFLWKIAFVAFGIFWLVMIFNCLQRDFKKDVDKVAWMLLLVFIPVVGAFLYLFWMYFGLKKKGKKRK